MANLIEECRVIFEQRRNKFGFWDRHKNRMKMPGWLKKLEDHPLHIIYKEQDMLFKEGRIVNAHIVQANSLLFERGKDSSPAVALFSEDPYFDTRLHELKRIGQHLFALKGTEDSSSEIQAFVDVITDEYTHWFNTPLPLELTEGRAIYYTTVMVQRNHLPVSYLKSGWFPVLVCPEKTKAAVILPSCYWATMMKERWLG